jgi:hypothetical protein
VEEHSLRTTYSSALYCATTTNAVTGVDREKSRANVHELPLPLGSNNPGVRRVRRRQSEVEIVVPIRLYSPKTGVSYQCMNLVWLGLDLHPALPAGLFRPLSRSRRIGREHGLAGGGA